jgi:O-methyltransferase
MTYLTLLKTMLLDLHRIGQPEYIPVVSNKNRKVTMGLAMLLNRFLSKRGIAICKIRNPSMEDRLSGRDWPGYADTMIGMKRLENISHCVSEIRLYGIKGDFIETGVWRGGACIWMKALLKYHAKEYGQLLDKKIFVADSFNGLPKPTHIQDHGSRFHLSHELAIPLETVKANFEKYGLLDDDVIFLKGWFKDTLPTLGKDQRFALIRLDGDMYGSTMDALVNLYPKLSVGGFCIIDDYNLKGAYEAAHDYRLEHGITDEIIDIDGNGAYWKKS